MKVVICGGPRTGKTSLAEKYRGLGIVRHTDELACDWKGASSAAATWMDEPGPWLIEGVMCSRGLRKWHELHPGEPPPVDRVIYLLRSHEPLSDGQQRLTKGTRTVHEQIEPWLAEHGITTEYRTT